MGRGDDGRVPVLLIWKESPGMGTEVGTGASGVHRRRQLLPLVLPSLTSRTSAVLRGGPC